MRKLKNKSLKGKKAEKEFAEILKKFFKSAQTEFKPRIINLSKDFWGLFDGLTFIRSKRKYIFWQIKSKKISKKEVENFWKMANIFRNKNIVVILIEKYKNNWKIYSNKQKFGGLKIIKKLI